MLVLFVLGGFNPGKREYVESGLMSLHGVLRNACVKGTSKIVLCLDFPLNQSHKEYPEKRIKKVYGIVDCDSHQK